MRSATGRFCSPPPTPRCRSSGSLRGLRQPRGLAVRPTLTRILIWSVVVGVLWVSAASGRHGADRDLARRAGARLRRPVRRVLEPRARAFSDRATGRSRAPHFAERFQLFVIIALGESIVVTGLTASGLDIDARAAGWQSRSRSSRRPRSGGCTSTTSLGSRSAGSTWQTTEGDSPGTPTRISTFRSIAGIIVTAVGDELVIAHPGEQLSAPELATVRAALPSTCSATWASGCAWPARSASSA